MYDDHTEDQRRPDHHLEVVRRAERALETTPGPSGLAANALLLGRMLRAHVQGRFRVNLWAAATAAAALLYLVTVTDAVPDVFPGAGLLDDAAVLATAVAVLRAELDRFRAWDSGR